MSIKILLSQNQVCRLLDLSNGRLERQFILPGLIKPDFTTGTLRLFKPATAKKIGRLLAEVDAALPEAVRDLGDQATTPRAIATATTTSRSLKA